MLPLLERSLEQHATQDVDYSSLRNMRHIAGMVDTLIPQHEIHGNILLAGCGSGFRERPLISQDPLIYPIPISPKISRIVGVDVADIDIAKDDFIQEDKVALFRYLSIVNYFEHKWDKKPFDYIFMLRVQRLSEQMSLSLPHAISSMLSPSGVFVTSGDSIALPLFQQNDYLKLITYEQVDRYAGAYGFYTNHMGFVATKKHPTEIE